MIELLVGIPVVIIALLFLGVVHEFAEYILGLFFLCLWIFVAFKIGEAILS